MDKKPQCGSMAGASIDVGISQDRHTDNLPWAKVSIQRVQIFPQAGGTKRLVRGFL
jgi:hypothetical protein